MYLIVGFGLSEAHRGGSSRKLVQQPLKARLHSRHSLFENNGEDVLEAEPMKMNYNSAVQVRKGRMEHDYC